jgi:hypothetical protein
MYSPFFIQNKDDVEQRDAGAFRLDNKAGLKIPKGIIRSVNVWIGIVFSIKTSINQFLTTLAWIQNLSFLPKIT